MATVWPLKRRGVNPRPALPPALLRHGASQTGATDDVHGMRPVARPQRGVHAADRVDGRPSTGGAAPGEAEPGASNAPRCWAECAGEPSDGVASGSHQRCAGVERHAFGGTGGLLHSDVGRGRDGSAL